MNILQNDKNEILNFKREKKEKDIEKMKFCIITCYKSQRSRNQLLMFTLENKY